jgi:hypothetical protein
MLRPLQDPLGRSGLDDPPALHHRDVVRRVLDDAEVVRDSEVSPALLHDLGHAQARVQRGERVLEDDLEPVSLCDNVVRTGDP